MRDKASKTYKTDGAPVDLILHFDLRFAEGYVVKSLVEKQGDLLNLPITDGPFKRVWIFDEHAQQVIWRSDIP